MVTLLTGLPRNGKSFLAVKMFWKELRHGNRLIPTNMPLLLPMLEKLVDKRKLPRRVLDRVRLLTSEETGKFWRVRNKPPKINGATGVMEGLPVMEFQEDGGCFYIIDEAHTKFRSHDWEKLGLEAPFYISQHGHLDDDVLLITQHVDKLVKALKLDVQTYVEVEYMRRQHWLCFQKGYHFKAKYWSAGIPESLHVKPNNIVPFFPDKEMMGIYDSKAGHGIDRVTVGHGDERLKGFPPWVAWVILLALGYAAIIGLSKGGSYVFNKVSGKDKKAKTEQVAKSSDPKATQGNAALPLAMENAEEAMKKAMQELKGQNRPEDALMVNGIVVGSFNGKLRYNVQLSDGRIVTEQDRDKDGATLIAEIGRSFVRFRTGEKIYMDERQKGISPYTQRLIERLYAKENTDRNILTSGPPVKDNPDPKSGDAVAPGQPDNPNNYHPDAYGRIDKIHPSG